METLVVLFDFLIKFNVSFLFVVSKNKIWYGLPKYLDFAIKRTMTMILIRKHALDDDQNREVYEQLAVY